MSTGFALSNRSFRAHHRAARLFRPAAFATFIASLAAALVFCRTTVSQADILVTSTLDSGPGTLRQAILDANADASGNPITITINVTGILPLGNMLPPITNDHGVTINGPISVGGLPAFNIHANNSRAFFIYATDPATQTVEGNVAINNLTISGALAAGGTGGLGNFGGGGGAGLGGAVFIGGGNVTLANVSLTSNQAAGGTGGAQIPSVGPGGGGGLGGAGGPGGTPQGSTVFVAPGGGGGVYGVSGSTAATGGFGGPAGPFSTGQPGPLAGFGSAGGGDFSEVGGTDGGGGAGGGSGGGGGGTNGQTGFLSIGGSGGFGGGGGGGLANGGEGGFGGGGGGGELSGNGSGGFGGGGGGYGGNFPGVGGFGGGNGAGLGAAGAGGGGGLGAGGGVFVRAGGSLTLVDGAFSGNTVVAGAGSNGGGNGSAIGQALFLGANVNWTVTPGNIVTVADTLGGANNPDAAGGLTKTGLGTLVLSAANNYVGGTTVGAGTLRIQNFGLPAPSVAVNSPGTLQYDSSPGNIEQGLITLSGTGKLLVTGANTVTFGTGNGNTINWNFSPGALIDVQQGTLVGGTYVNDNWINNKASLNIAAGATFVGVEANVQIDALTGAGTFSGGYIFGGTETIGVAGGSGNFSGSLQDFNTANGWLLSLVKVGTGTQTLSGPNTYSGSTTVANGTLATTSTGTLGNGPLAVNAATATTSVVNFGNSQAVSALSGSVAGTGSARVNVAPGKSLTVNQSSNTTFAGTVALADGATPGAGAGLAKSNSGTLEIDGGLSLGSNSSLAVSGGRLRLNVATGSPSIGGGVTATVSGGAILELAGAVSTLGTAAPLNRTAIHNNDNAAVGLLVSAGTQQVGGIDGPGATQVNPGASLTADHIIESALLIGGAPGTPALVTIAPSDSTGNPLSDGTLLADALPLGDPLAAGANFADLAGGTANGDRGFDSFAANHSLPAGAPAVPEPSALFLFAIGALAFEGLQSRTKHDRRRRPRLQAL